MKSKCILASLLLILIQVTFAGVVSAQRILYVNQSAAGMNNGSSWDDAFVFLQDALATAASGDEIWVATGIYRPDQGSGIAEGNRSASFIFSDGIAIYGGFEGNELVREDRDREMNETILSGDLLSNDNGVIDVLEPTRSDNSMHVVTGQNLRELVILDGFTITGGNALPGEGSGAGISIEQDLVPLGDNASRTGNYLFANVWIKTNAGGGAFIRNAGEANSFSDVSFENAVFENNTGGAVGGGMYGRFSIVTLKNVSFYNNTADIGAALYMEGPAAIYWGIGVISGNYAHSWGGAIVLGGEIPSPGEMPDTEFVGFNLFFVGNYTDNFGGAIVACESSLLLVNSVFSGNIATTLHGGGIVNDAGILKVVNSTFSGNQSGSEGGAIYNSNSDVSPDFSLFVDNSIFWNNSALLEGNDVFNNRTSTGFARSNLFSDHLEEGLMDGGGNLFADPLFVDAGGDDGVFGTPDDDVRLTIGSQAIDVGNNLYVSVDILDVDRNGDVHEVLPIDLDENRRIVAGHGSDLRVDLGAYEFGSTPVSILVDEEIHPLPSDKPEVVVYPNPIADRGIVSIRGIPIPGRVDEYAKISLYDTLGREVQVVSAEFHLTSYGALLPLNFSYLPSGLYILKLASKTWSHSKLIVKTK